MESIAAIKFLSPKIGLYIKRYNRFLLDVLIDNQVTTVYCPNPGRMEESKIPGALCLLSKTKSKLPYKWEAIFFEEDNCWVGVNMMNANLLIEKYLNKIFPNEIFKKEVLVSPLYKADFANDKYIIEVKTLNWRRGNICYFPDCPSVRGSKQMIELAKLSDKYQCYVIFVLQREDIKLIEIAKDIDINYYQSSLIAKDKGVKFLAYNCSLSEEYISIKDEISILL